MKKLTLEELTKEFNMGVKEKNITSTNIISLDLLFNGGIESRKVYQIIGDSSSGKTTIALQVVKKMCDDNKKVLYIDTENSIDMERINKFELNNFINSKLFINSVSTFDEIEEIIDNFIITGEINMIVIDSIASIINKGYLNIEHSTKSSKNKKITITNNNSNYDSRPLSLFLKKYSALANKYNFSLFLTNQKRNKIDKQKGTIEKVFGPKVLDSITNTIIKITTPSNNEIKEKLKSLTNVSVKNFEVVKSSLFAPKKTIPFVLDYNKGIDDVIITVIYLLEKNEILQAGTYYKFKDSNNSFNGIFNFIYDNYGIISKYKEYNYNEIVDFCRNYS